MEYILPLRDCHSHFAEVVGGKAMGLGSLLRQELPVPPGFAVSTHAYREFVEVTGLERAIQSNLQHADTLEDQLIASEEIRSLFEELELQAPLFDELAEAYEQLGEQGSLPVAVRSSSVSEDAAEASFAGEHDTYLWIQGPEAVARNVLRCWSSLFTPQALAYFRQFNLRPNETAMGVVVQSMVAAEAAGVMITIDPVTGDRSQISIEGSCGLGLSVVGGEVTPDRYFVDKVTLDIRSRMISPKGIAYRFDSECGEVRRVDIPPDEQMTPCLEEKEVISIAALGKQVERALGTAQDIEWALGPGASSEREIYLLQTRPETIWRNKQAVPISNANSSIMSRLVGNMSVPMRIV
ncbi:MAG: PEP/pyruvate-binding domain-containing protein [Actinomycetota bacterium]|jgi:pyruvate,water dikinase|nr:PEP/pyruvate-binding domain-containing protein [Actinomycetota bacterium]